MIPDYCEAITGYRCWNVHSNGLLVGQNHVEPWPPYETFVGRCGYAYSPNHVHNGEWQTLPIFDCFCGIHAFKKKEQAEVRASYGKYSWAGIRDVGEDAVVWGEVKLWGKVIVHDEGYRAQFAYPGELWCSDEALAYRVSRLYGVPCHYKEVKQEEEEEGLYPLFTWWRRGYSVTAPAAPPPAHAPLLHRPSLHQIKAIGATPWQQQQAQMQAKQVPMLAGDWRDMWRDAFKVKKPMTVQAGHSL